MIVHNNPSATHLIAHAAGVVFNADFDVCLARIEEKDGMAVTRGGIIIQNYNKASIYLHMAGFDGRWINTDMLWITFDYPFNQLKVRKILCPIPSKNTRSLAINLRLGFKIEARIADVFPDDDMILTSIVRENCRWLDIKPKGIQRRYSDG
jgi:RimJ/RimL family protein N-acetyltransferase